MTSQNPFAAPLDPAHVFLTDTWRAALERLGEAPGQRDPVLLVIGAPGTGTSTLVSAAIARGDGRTAVARVATPALSRTDLVEELARLFGARTTAGSRPQVLAALAEALAAHASAGRVPVVVIDDAHLLPDEALDELRLLADAEARAGRALELLLAGTPALEARLASEAHASLRDRVALHVRLSPFSAAETRQYVHHRVRTAGGDGPRLFPRRACTAVHMRSGGAVRAINRIAGESLRGMRAGGESVVTPEHVDAAAAALELDAGATPVAPVAPPAPVARADAPEPAAATPERAGAARPVAQPAAEPPPPVAKVEEPPPPITRIAAAADPHPRSAPATSRRAKRGRRGTSSPAPAPAPAPAAAPSTAAPEPHEERARDWVKRFVGSQGPPRIGAALMPATHAADDEPLCAAADVLPDDVPRKPLKLVVLDDLPDDVPDLPSARRALPPVRHLRTAPRRVVAIACATVTVCAAGGFAALQLTGASPWRSRTPAVATIVSAPPTTTAPVSAPAPVIAATPRRAVPSTSLAASRGSAAPVVTPVEPEREPEPQAAETPPVANDDPPAAIEPAPAPPAAERLGLEVGTFLDRERAQLECDRLSADSGLRAWIVTSSEYGAASYRVVLGVFRSRERAEASATVLLERGLVTEAQVVALPPKRARGR